MTDQQITADEAAVTAADAALAVAEQNLAQATIVSPIAGTVSAVGLTAGSSASAGSSSSAITVIGGDTHVVTLTVGVAKVSKVKVGESVAVTPDGSTTALPAKVVAVGAGPTTSGGSSYAVTVGFTGEPVGLRNGINVAVTITTTTSSGTVSVPTSAVHYLNKVTYVIVLNGDATKTTTVTIGAIGPVYTEITSGLKAGAKVILANLDSAVPTSSTNTTRFGSRSGLSGSSLGGSSSLGGGGGGFSGGGAPPR